jgi:hypothetical protein
MHDAAVQINRWLEYRGHIRQGFHARETPTQPERLFEVPSIVLTPVSR